MDTAPPPEQQPSPDAERPFLVTKEHRRFTEFAEACRRERYIGLCYGPPGVGKTLSARYYARWDLIERYLPQRFCDDSLLPPQALAVRTAMYTAPVVASLRQISSELRGISSQLSSAIEGHLFPDRYTSTYTPYAYTDLVIVDEADRLKTTALEVVRDHYDQADLGMILIGMPGLEKRLARYPQLYSRIGFVHEYRPLSPDELTFVLRHHHNRIGLPLSASDFTDTEALAAIHRITLGNFRLVHRLFAQITRILEINGLRTITKEVVETARESLVIGTL
ncbi:AAA family ATPase [Streptosporangium sp. NPDC002721]|uniref:AAA family ATPase n=1 Tax=Streptosporangium sp. NPDC002721 TaxID=3366188 RepID=UPI0036AC369A